MTKVDHGRGRDRYPDPDLVTLLDHVDEDGNTVPGLASRAAITLGLSPSDAQEVGQDAVVEARRTWNRRASFETYFFGPPGMKKGLLQERVNDFFRKRKESLLDPLDAEHETIAGKSLPLQDLVPHPWPGEPDLPIVPTWRDGPDGPVEVHVIDIPPPEKIKAMYDGLGSLTRTEAIRLKLADAGKPIEEIARLEGVLPQAIRDSLASARKKRQPVPAPRVWIDAGNAPQWWYDGLDSDPNPPPRSHRKKRGA
jgi:hypothetical protein